MPLSPENTVLIRKWIGDEPVDATLNSLYDQFVADIDVLRPHDAVVDHVLHQRLAALSLEPSSVTVPGLSVSHGSDLQALQELMKQWRASGGLGLDETTPTSVGRNTRRWPR